MKNKIYDFGPTTFNHYNFNESDIFIEPKRIKKLRKSIHNSIPVYLSIEKMTTIDSLIKEFNYYGNKYNYAVLNFMDYLSPEPNMDYSTQQDHLYSRSNLYDFLSVEKEFYITNYERQNLGLYDHRLIYSPNVEFRNKYNTSTVLASVISCSFPDKYLMDYLKYQYKYKKSYYIQIIKNRIKSILDIALDNNVDILILGAIGCGYSGNNPEIISDIFMDVIRNKYYDKFKKITFAIPDEGKRVLFFNPMHCYIKNFILYEEIDYFTFNYYNKEYRLLLCNDDSKDLPHFYLTDPDRSFISGFRITDNDNLIVHDSDKHNTFIEDDGLKEALIKYLNTYDQSGIKISNMVKDYWYMEE